MNSESLIFAVIGSLGIGVAALLIYLWWLPLFRRSVQRPVEPLLQRVGEIGFDETTIRARLFAIELCVSTIIAYVSWKWLGLVLGVTIAGISYHLRAMVLGHLIEHRERLLRGQILKLTSGLVGLSQSGLILRQALETLCRETANPLGAIIHRIVGESNSGRPLGEAMMAAKYRLKLDAFSLMISALTQSHLRGATLSSLAGLQESLIDRDRMEQQLRSKTSAARSEIFLLSLFPMGCLAFAAIAMPDSAVLLLTHPIGRISLAGILFLLYAGLSWGHSLLKIK